MGRIYDLPTLTDVGDDDYFVAESMVHGTGKVPMGGMLAGTYDGKDLELIFADEIEKSDGDPWKWIQNRCYDRNYAGLRPKDYIKFTLDGYTYRAQIAGLEPYFNCCDGDYRLAGHIDFICKELYPEVVQWNTTNNNNGNSTSAYPYMVSNLKKFYEELEDKLPGNLANVILDKRSHMEQKYSSSGTLTDSNSQGWQSIGKLWAPHECEIFGRSVCSHYRSNFLAVQYPLFQDGREIVKFAADDNETRCAWWECDTRLDSSTSACDVGTNGTANNNNTSNEYRAALGFRIGYEA